MPRACQITTKRNNVSRGSRILQTSKQQNIISDSNNRRTLGVKRKIMLSN